MTYKQYVADESADIQALAMSTPGTWAVSDKEVAAYWVGDAVPDGDFGSSVETMIVHPTPFFHEPMKRFGSEVVRCGHGEHGQHASLQEAIVWCESTMDGLRARPGNGQQTRDNRSPHCSHPSGS